MAPLYKTAAVVCLVALCGLQAEASTPTYKFTVEDVQEDAYLAANLARNGKLPVHISEVTKDDNLVSTLEAKVSSEEPPTAANCTALITAQLKERFHYSFEHEPASQASPDYRQLLQDALDEGLKTFNEEYFNGLIERTTQLKDMTKDDLKNSVGNGPVATASTILIAGLVAMLTAVSA
ncbi:uncharacterized protein EMH_0035990 [Eimeria mitis]|uniref:SAG family member n=1 Tax=Eimeria mitis TaxID=44415 RepID=U6JR17_9EIME|nr:uncharacterized protein EMH_0035990 [Eimeria mitis]CDJ27905.1 hypothetical protein EMH_0035990 [Eimeria mitis]